MSTVEQVVLLDDFGHAIGTADKATVHHESTPLHLAFSCYLFDDRDRLLLTRRALTKKTWPGVWTNTCCGHPAPGETAEDGVRRRVRDELGVGIDDLRLVLPTFRYRAVMDNGVVEHELCPVYVGRPLGDLRPDPAEVDDATWTPWSEVRAGVAAGTSGLSPWSVIQVAALPEHPWLMSAADDAELPPAARRR